MALKQNVWFQGREFLKVTYNCVILLNIDIPISELSLLLLIKGERRILAHMCSPLKVVPGAQSRSPQEKRPHIVSR